MLRMTREQGCVMDEEIGVLCGGKIFRHSRKRIVAKREGQYNEIEERDTGVILMLECCSILRGGGESILILFLKLN